MSTTVDQRIVEMQFDNRHFEKNVQTSMSTLDKLKNSLNLTGASKGLENINTESRRFSMAGVSSAVETVSARFSAMQVVAITALANITNSAVNTGKRMLSALTIDPIKTGFSEYETQINAVQTILANTSSKGTTLDQVNTALDTLNTYADKTIYNFTEMTRNIGTFTAAGVDLDTSVSSIQGIANLAAVSGSTSQQASTAMYQLSQALAAGKVSLMDWNSVVNAGMGGQVFQDALKRTATVMGTDVDALIEKYGSFRESLTQGEWLTTDVLTATLEQFTMAAEEGSEEWNNFKKSLMEQGYTEAQATEILKMANTATDAATKVKTFTQLWDTLKEAAQSGWTQTWEILVGDFEEAKTMLTNVSNVINDIIGESAKARNDLLQGWKDEGGRTEMLAGFVNIWEGIKNVVVPIKDAFTDIFPPITVKQLMDFTKGFKDLTSKFAEFTSKHSEHIKSAFKGIFSIVDIGLTFFKELGVGIVNLLGHFGGFSGGILGATGSLGDWLSNLRDGVKESGIFAKSIEFITNILGKVIDGVTNFGKKIKDTFGGMNFGGFTGFFENLYTIIKTISSKIVDLLTPIGKSIAGLFENANLFDVLNSSLLAGSFVGIQKFAGGFEGLIGNFTDMFESIGGEEGIIEKVKGIFDGVRETFEAYQQNLQAGTLQKIATAIAILAASIFIVSSIDGEALDRSLGAIGVMFAELMASMYVFTKIDMKSIKGVTKVVPIMIGMSIAILMLAGAMKSIASLSWEGIAKGLIGVFVLLAEISLFLDTYSFDGKKMTSSAVGIVIISSAMLILAKAVSNFGAMSWGEIGKGLTAIGALLGELAIFSRLTGNAKHVISTGISMALLGASMKIFASAMSDFGSMSWGEIGKGLIVMAGALAEVIIAMKLMPATSAISAVGLIAVGAALKILASVMSDFSGMSWEGIGKGLTVMGGALAEIAIALILMNGTISGSAALIIAAGALAIITPVLKTLGGMSWEGIAKGLVALAGAFAVIGIAGALLTPLIPSLLGLSAAFALFGIATLAFGAGVMAISAGFASLAAAGVAGATALVAALSIIVVGILDIIPSMVKVLGEIISSLCVVLVECTPQIVDTILIIVTELLSSLATYTPQILSALMEFLIGLLDGLAAYLPQLITSAVNLIGAFFQGIVDALSGLDTTSIFKGLIGIGLLAGLMFALSAVASLIPGAMIGVLGMGVVIAELALVLAAIGLLAQIPGLNWLVTEGGNFLQSIGTAIGQFVGGIVGGIAQGITSSLPQMGSDLSDFMKNIQPFLDGAQSIDPSILDGVESLASAVLILTGANLLESLTSWLTGGNSLADFATQLVPFGAGMKAYANEVAGIDSASITASATAAKNLAEVAKAIPASGDSIWGLIAGEKSLGDFATQLVPFGVGLKAYAAVVTGLDSEAISASASAAKGLAQVAKAIPASGDSIWGLIAGEQDLGTFGTQLVSFGHGMKSYSKEIVGLDADSITASVTAAKSLVKVAKAIPKEGGLWGIISGDKDLGSFGNKLVPFGTSLKKYSAEVVGVDSASIESSVTAAKKLVNFIDGLGDMNTDGVSSFKSAVSSLAQTNVSGFVEAFDSASSKAASAGTKLVSNLTSGMNKQKSSTTKSATDIVTNVVKTLNSKSAQFTKAGSDMVTKLISGITKQKSKVTSAVKSTISSSVSSLRNYYTNFYNAGSYLVDGFCKGINANRYRAAAQARAMAQVAEQAAKQELDINSPSKKFIKIGEGVPEGFAIGISRFGSSVKQSVTSMADTAIISTKSAMGRLSKIIGDGIDVEPTIRPVVDLSNVSSSARAIDNLLGIGSTIGVSSNLSHIGSTIGNQNGNDDVVNAIDKLRNSLGNVGNTNYNINGVTYDDGSNIHSAVEAIVRAARIGGRV